MRPERTASGTRTVPFTVAAADGPASARRSGKAASVRNDFDVVIAVDGHGSVIALTLSNLDKHARARLWRCRRRRRAALFFRANNMATRPYKSPETFPKPKPERDYVIRFDCPEFTCLCPKTGQPDFATIRVEYVPDRLCVELKSWKVYLWSYRDEGAFHEAVTNRILDDLVAAISPRRMRVEGAFNVRGGITTTIVADHTKV